MDSYNGTEVEYVSRCLEEYPNTKLKIFGHENFSYPYSVNLGMHFSSEDLVCIINGHSLPISLKWLERGLKYFSDERVAAVMWGFSSQIEGLDARYSNWLKCSCIE